MSRKRKEFKHLTVNERILINGYLNIGKTVSEIARELNVDKSTISREISRYGTVMHGGHIPCEFRDARGVCNGCKKPNFCDKSKVEYAWESADRRAEERLRKTRSGSRLEKDDIAYIDSTVTPLIRNGQSINHAYVGDDRLPKICSQSTLRRLIYRGELTCKAHELKNFVKFAKPKREYVRKVSLKKPEVLIGRTYADFRKYVAENPDAIVTEYDSVVGKNTDRKAILTVTFAKYRLQFGFLVEKGVASSVTSSVRTAFRRSGSLKETLFEAMLADNGSEFATFYALEDDEGRVRTFYTRPYTASDKPHCERNHEFVRDLFPKGKSLDGVTQEMLDEAFSHINSYVRPVLGNRTPYDAFAADFGTGFLEKMKLRRIENKKVRLRPLI